jgi:hypothetical protein
LVCPVIRIGPNKVHVKHGKAHGTLDKHNNVLEDRSYYNVGLDSATGLIPDGKIHRHRRSHMITLLSAKLESHLDTVIRRTSSQLTARAREHAVSNQPLNLLDAYRSLGHDIMSALFFGNDDNCLSSPNFAHELHQMCRGLFCFLSVVRQFPFLPSALKLLPHHAVRKFVPVLRYNRVRRTFWRGCIVC